MIYIPHESLKKIIDRDNEKSFMLFFGLSDDKIKFLNDFITVDDVKIKMSLYIQKKKSWNIIYSTIQYFDLSNNEKLKIFTESLLMSKSIDFMCDIMKTQQISSKHIPNEKIRKNIDDDNANDFSKILNIMEDKKIFLNKQLENCSVESYIYKSTKRCLKIIYVILPYIDLYQKNQREAYMAIWICIKIK